MADEIDWEAAEMEEMDRQERDGEMRALVRRVEALEAAMEILAAVHEGSSVAVGHAVSPPGEGE